MNILITGGAGYIGTELAYKLSELPGINSVIIYDNLSRNNYNIFIGKRIKTNKLSFIKGDILDSRKLKESLVNVNVVCHLAAKVTTPFSNEDPHFFEQVNHWGTSELVKAVEESNVENFIYLSSTSVYGQSSQILDINTEPAPDTFYGISKFRGEKHVNRLFNKINTVILRCGNIYGYSPSMRFDAVINRFMFEAHFFNRISIHGNGNQTRAFIHIDKTIYVLTKLITKSLESGTYNLVDKNLSVIEICKSLKKIYPQLETLYINQHLNMRSLKIKQDLRLQSFFPADNKSFESGLKVFRNQFTFNQSDISVNA